MSPKLTVLLATCAVALPLDQLTKLWVANRIPADSFERIPVIDGFFYITHVRNPGAAFGLLVDWPWEWRLPIFLGVAIAAGLVIISFYRSLAPGERFNALALGLVLAGAIGNLIDRLTRGEVIDFLQIELFGGWAWPDFNVADVCIVVGVTALIVELLASEGASRASPPEAASETASPDRSASDLPDGK